MKRVLPPCWHFSSEKVKDELKGDPLFLLGNGELIKSNAIRQVYRSGEYYIKLDRRANRSFSGEFNSALLCEAENIPVVEHLAWGRSSEGSWLVTRAANGFVEAASLFRYRQENCVYEAMALFLKKVFNSGIWHPDLHAGNVLIEPDSCRCLLVDLHGVRKKNFFDRFRKYRMQRCIMEFRNTLSDLQMCRLITLCGIDGAEKFFAGALRREAALLQALMPKRRIQILKGYFKYTRIENSGRLVDVEVDGSELEQTVSEHTPHAAGLFLFHFFLTLAKIPHTRILACDPEENICYWENEIPEKFRSDAAPAELCRRLRCNGIKCEESDFAQGYLSDLAGVFLKNHPSGE